MNQRPPRVSAAALVFRVADAAMCRNALGHRAEIATGMPQTGPCCRHIRQANLNPSPGNGIGSRRCWVENVGSSRTAFAKSVVSSQKPVRPSRRFGSAFGRLRRPDPWRSRRPSARQPPGLTRSVLSMLLLAGGLGGVLSYGIGPEAGVVQSAQAMTELTMPKPGSSRSRSSSRPASRPPPPAGDHRFLRLRGGARPRH